MRLGPIDLLRSILSHVATSVSVGLFLALVGMVGRVCAQESTLPSTAEFMNVMTVCGAGSRVKIDANIEGSVSSIYQKERTRGRALQEIITKIIDQLPAADRAEAYRHYLDCVLAALQAKTPVKITEIDVINTTYALPENEEVIELLRKSDGKRVYLNTINADLSLGENYDVVKQCFPANKISKKGNGHLLTGNLNGLQLPIPTSDFKSNGCLVYFEIDSLDRRPYPQSSGGTGIVNFLIRKTFVVNVQYSGATTTFNLREARAD
jgi:hypothetical protein